MKLKLLTTTAIIALSLSSVAQAQEKSWFENMTQAVQTWFAGEEQTSAEVETYLDEVTIAVPPMTAEEAAGIQPAAGDYQESLEEALENIPGSIQNDEQSFNTDFSYDSGSVAAFEDPTSAEDLANIMPAAGDAEEVTDDSVIVAQDAQEVTDEAVIVAQDAEEAAEEMSETIADFAEETQETSTETFETAVERVEPKSMTTQTNVVVEEIATPVTTETMTETTEQAATETMEQATDEVEAQAEATIEEAVEEIQEMAQEKADEVAKDAMEPAAGAVLEDKAMDAAQETLEGVTAQ